jgi:hypothetical protein
VTAAWPQAGSEAMMVGMTAPEAPDAVSRRQARAAWPVVVRRLDAADDDDIFEVTPPAERIAMMWPLAEEAWRLAGRPIPTYDRARTPSRLFRGGELRSDDTEP